MFIYIENIKENTFHEFMVTLGGLFFRLLV